MECGRTAERAGRCQPRWPLHRRSAVLPPVCPDYRSELLRTESFLDSAWRLPIPLRSCGGCRSGRLADRLGLSCAGLQAVCGQCQAAGRVPPSSARDRSCRPRHGHGRLPLGRSKECDGCPREGPPGPEVRPGLGPPANHLRHRRQSHPRRAVHLRSGIQNQRLSLRRPVDGKNREEGRGEGREKRVKSTINNQQSSISLPFPSLPFARPAPSSPIWGRNSASRPARLASPKRTYSREA